MISFEGKNLTERKLEQIYVGWLKSQGCEEVKLHSKASLCDIIVRHNGRLSLHEVKLICGSADLHRGVGQLLFYCYQMEQKHGEEVHGLVLVSLSELDDEAQAFLKSLGIEYRCLFGVVTSFFRMQETERILKNLSGSGSQEVFC